MDTQTQIERLIELAIVQRTELKQLVEQLPQLREHLNAEIERNLEEIEPQLRSELEEFCDKRAVDANAKVGSALEAKIIELSKALELTTQARFNAIKEQERKVEELRQLAAKQIEGHVATLPEAVKEIVGAELARFPRAGEIDQLRKEFAEPKGLNPRGKWLPSETYNRLDLVTYNGDSFTSAIDGNRSRPSRNAAEWTLIAARGTGGGGPTSLSELTTVPSNGDLLIGSGTSWVTSNLTAGAGISITVGAGEITISATDGDITLDDGTAASPSLHFTNDPDTGIYRPAANTLGISVSGTQVAYFDENGLTIPSAGVVAGGSFHAANGNANNPSHSFTSDQDTGFFRHQPNELGVALGGTQYATLTSTTFSVTPALSVAGVSRVTNSTASSSTTTGALVVTGGVGIGGAANVGGNVTVSGTTDSTSKDTGAIVTEGGLGVEKSATIGGQLTVSGTGVSAVSGALQVSGFYNGFYDTSILALGSATKNPRITLGSTSAYRWSLLNNDVGGNGEFVVRYEEGPLNALSVTRSGNVGIGVTPSSWSSAHPAIQFKNSTAISSYSSIDGLELTSNGYADGATTWKYIETYTAAQYVIGNGAHKWYSAASGTADTAITWSDPKLTLTNGGNLLLGTTTDSSNGKLQLATHTTSAGGIGFGTDTALYRTTDGRLAIDHIGGNLPDLILRENGATKLELYTLNGVGYLGTYTAKSLVLQTNNTTALTLDSSQNCLIGATTASAKLTVQNDISIRVSAGELLRINAQVQTSVSTTATAILATSFGYGTLAIVNGYEGANAFTDFVFFGYSGTPTVISSQTITASPVARTYTAVTGQLKLAMASGTYTVNAVQQALNGI